MKLIKNKFLIAMFFFLGYLFFTNSVSAGTDVSFEFQGNKYSTTIDKDVTSYVVIDNQGSVFLFATSIEDDMFCKLSGDWAYFFTNADGSFRKSVWVYEYSFANNCFVYKTADWSVEIGSYARLGRVGGNVGLYVIEDGMGYNPKGFVTLTDSFTVNLHISTTEADRNFVEIYTDYISQSYATQIEDYLYCISGQNWKNMHVRTKTDKTTNNVSRQYYFNAYENAVYYVRIIKAGKSYTSTFTVTNIKESWTETTFGDYIIDNNFNQQTDIKIDRLILGYDYLSNTAISIHTQCFSLAQVRKFVVEAKYADGEWRELSEVQWNKPRRLKCILHIWSYCV